MRVVPEVKKPERTRIAATYFSGNQFTTVASLLDVTKESKMSNQRQRSLQ